MLTNVCSGTSHFKVGFAACKEMVKRILPPVRRVHHDEINEKKIFIDVVQIPVFDKILQQCH